MQKVLRLQWIAAYHNENGNVVRMDGLPDPNNSWYSLGMMQRRRLAAMAANMHMFPDTRGSTRNKISVMLEQQEARSIPCDVLTHDHKTGRIVIPATANVNPTQSTNKVVFLPSFLGGKQLFLKEDAEIEYSLPHDFLTNEAAQFKLTCRVSTVHRKEQPILLTIGPTVYTVTLPYTMGLWADSKPVVVELEYATSKLRFTRPNQMFGFSIKDITLLPV